MNHRTPRFECTARALDERGKIRDRQLVAYGKSAAAAGKLIKRTMPGVSIIAIREDGWYDAEQNRVYSSTPHSIDDRRKSGFA